MNIFTQKPTSKPNVFVVPPVLSKPVVKPFQLTSNPILQANPYQKPAPVFGVPPRPSVLPQVQTANTTRQLVTPAPFKAPVPQQAGNIFLDNTRISQGTPDASALQNTPIAKVPILGKLMVGTGPTSRGLYAPDTFAGQLERRGLVGFFGQKFYDAVNPDRERIGEQLYSDIQTRKNRGDDEATASNVASQNIFNQIVPNFLGKEREVDKLKNPNIKLTGEQSRSLLLKNLGRKAMAVLDAPGFGATTKPVTQGFKNFPDLSSKFLGKLEGKTTVSKQFLSDMTNSPDLKQPEKDLFRRLLETEGDVVDVPAFAGRVKKELLPLTSRKQAGDLKLNEQALKAEIATYRASLTPAVKVRQMTRSREIPSLEATAKAEEARLARREPPFQKSQTGQSVPRPPSVPPPSTAKGILSSPIPSTETGKKLSTLRKFVTGGEKILRESGPSGKKMAKIMDVQRTKEDLLTGRYTVRINKALAGLSKEERFDVTKVLEGGKPMNEKVATAATELRTWLDEVATRAEKDKFSMRVPAHSVTTKTPLGDVKKVSYSVPFKKRENYYPRQYDLDSAKKQKQAVGHLVKTGQARNLAEAEKILQELIEGGQRRAGNLENPRKFDLPGYEKDPLKALPRYAQSVAKRFTEADHFGKDDGKIAHLIKKITNEGGDYKEAQRIFDFTVDGSPKNKVVSAITQFNVATKLSLSAILNATQSINTITKFGIKNTVKGIWRGFTKQGKELAELQNVYDDFILVKEGGYNPSKIVKGVMYIFKKVEHFNRRTASNTGHYAIPELVQKLTKDPQSGYAMRQLESLGIDLEKALTGKLTDDDLMFGINKAIQKTQFKVDPLDLPPSWKTPLGRLLVQFKSFTFMQTKFVRDEILKEARHGNLVPLVTFVSLAIPASYLVTEVRNKLTGRSTDDETKIDIREWDKWMKAFGTIPTDLIIQGKFLKDTYQSTYKTPLEKGARTLGTFFGPTADEAGKLVAGAEQIPRTQEKNKYLRKSGREQDPYLALKRQGVEKIPFAGQFLKNKYFGYPKSNTSPEKKAFNQGVYGFADEMAQLPFGSEEAKTKTRAYLEGIKDETERKRQAYILNQNGIDTKGISTSDRMIEGRPLYDQAQQLINEGKYGEAQRIASTWTTEQKDAYGAVKSSESTKRTETFKEFLDSDPQKAVEYARSLRPDQQENLKDFLTRKGNEEWMIKYQTGK